VEFISEPFEAEFVQTGALAAALVGVLCGVVGCYVILRGLALMADSLAHGVLPGIAIAFMITSSGAGAASSEPDQLAIGLGALVAGLVTAGATGLILRRSRLREETAAAVVFVFMLALGVVLISRVDGYTVDLTAFLFGDVLGVEGADVVLTAVLTAAILALVALLYRPFLILSFDRQRAAALGLPIDRLHLVMLVVVTLAVVVGFRVVGALLVLGMLMAPPAAAALVTKRLPAMMAVSAAIAAASAPIGLLISWHLDLAAGASIVLVPVTAFLLLLLFRPAVR
jgi:ABC-type Mn2+/Zn2+ transport system permease subunit